MNDSGTISSNQQSLLREFSDLVTRYERALTELGWSEQRAKLATVSAREQIDIARASGHETSAPQPFPYPTDRDGWICSVCHGWNVPKDRVCMHSHLPTDLQKMYDQHAREKGWPSSEKASPSRTCTLCDKPYVMIDDEKTFLCEEHKSCAVNGTVSHE